MHKWSLTRQSMGTWENIAWPEECSTFPWCKEGQGQREGMEWERGRKGKQEASLTSTANVGV